MSAPAPPLAGPAAEDPVVQLSDAYRALANDVQRIHFVLRELEAVGVLPPLPWALAQARMDLQYQAHAIASTEAEPSAEQLAEFEAGRQRVEALRREYVASLLAAEGCQESPEPLPRK